MHGRMDMTTGGVISCIWTSGGPQAPSDAAKGFSIHDSVLLPAFGKRMAAWNDRLVVPGSLDVDHVRLWRGVILLEGTFSISSGTTFEKGSNCERERAYFQYCSGPTAHAKTQIPPDSDSTH